MEGFWEAFFWSFISSLAGALIGLAIGYRAGKKTAREKIQRMQVIISALSGAARPARGVTLRQLKILPRRPTREPGQSVVSSSRPQKSEEQKESQ